MLAFNLLAAMGCDNTLVVSDNSMSVLLFLKHDEQTPLCDG